EALQKLSAYPNDCAIGIEMCVNQDGDFQTMYKRTVELAADILKRYGWGADKYTGLAAGQAWAKFKADVQAALKPSPQPTQKAVDKVLVEINGKRLAAAGYLKDGVSWLPIRAVDEAPGGKVEGCQAIKQGTVNGHDLTKTIESGVSYAP
ncbi:N-acetylmuramoyl-L-alanine amidase, partial [Mesorhizobium sp. M00.F.Ca.ET.186.01.1.1]